LLNQLAEVQPLLEVINSEGAELSEIAPGDASFRVEDMILKDNKRFDALRAQIEKRADKARQAREKNMEVSNVDEGMGTLCSSSLIHPQAQPSY
jgi:small-conductance mechanosensitive channel